MKEYTISSLKGKLILFVTILASGMAFLDGSVVNIAMPTIQTQMHATLTDIQWVVNAYVLMLCALILISGALGDRFGRKKVFLYGIIVFVFASFLCSISQSIVQLAIFRGLQGVGGALMVPGSLSIINTSFSESIRGRVIGLWSGFAGGIAALGPFVGGWLVQSYGWPFIFYINIPIGLIALLIALTHVPESHNKEATKLDRAGAVFIFLSLVGITYGLISISNLGWQNPLIAVSLLGGIVSFILFYITERRVKEPLVPFTIFTSSLVTGANIATFFLYFALSGVIFFLVLNFQQIQHYSPILAGLGLMPTILLITFLSGVGGTIADKLGPRIPMIVGPLLVALGMTFFIFSGRNANYVLQYLPGLILFGLGMSFVIAPLTKSALAVDEKYAGAASGVNNAIARIAGLLAVAVLGLIVLSLFEGHLRKDIAASSMNITEKQQIIAQESKLGGITIPKSFTPQSFVIAKRSIEEAFIFGFRWAMSITAFLALVSSAVAFFTIRNNKP
ncbi:MAG TPA: MFS transporter [Candidatus Saccharimonadales bacterium]|nr:MFS transporter [Candidatus Saccharimonadales bacterium]